MCDASDPEIFAAYEDVRSDQSDTDWCLVGYKDNNTVVFHDKGTGGLNAMIEKLDEGSVFYFYLRVTTVVEETTRNKFVFGTWKGPKASVMRKAKVSVHTSNVKSVLKDYAIEVHAVEIDDLDEKEMMKKLAAANY